MQLHLEALSLSKAKKERELISEETCIKNAKEATKEPPDEPVQFFYQLPPPKHKYVPGDPIGRTVELPKSQRDYL